MDQNEFRAAAKVTTFQGLVTALAVAQVLDWLTTYLAISSGKGREANGGLNALQRWLYTKGYEGKWVWLTLSKSLACGMCIMAAVLVQVEQPLFVNALVGAAVAFYAYVIFNNYRIYDK